MALNFLFTSWGNPGTLNPILTAARRLRQRGHRVRILGDVAHHEETAKAGFDTLSWRRPPAIIPPTGDDPVWDEVRALLGQVTFGAAIDYAADTLDALRAEPVDAVVSQGFLGGPVIAAESRGIPCALLKPHVSVRPVEGIPTCISGAIPSEDPRYKAEDLAARDRLTALMNSYLPMLNRARAAFGLVPLNDIFDHYDRVDRVFIGLSPAFDFPATKLPVNLRYVGPLLDPPAWTREWTAPWAGSPARPRILVSLSTSFQNQAALLRRIVATLGRMDLDAVVTMGPAMEKEAIDAPANVTLVHSAPHDAVMKEVSLVVTHGGHGTVTRALVNGMPLLVIPMGRDQADNAARVVGRGAGLSLSDSATEEEIASAVGRLIAEPTFKAAAERLGKAIAPDLASPVFVTEMEAIATRRQRRTA